MSVAASRRFDDPAPPSAFAVAGRLLRSRWGAVLAYLVATAILTFIAVAWLLVGAGGAAVLEAAVAATPISVAAGADATSADVQALGASIRARPDIAAATLRAKDDGLRLLTAAGLPPPDGRNPLPDVWIVTLAPRPIVLGERSLSDSVSALRSALGRLSNVDTVRIDGRYVARVDAITTGWLRLAPATSIGILCALGVVLACASFLAGSALVSRNGGASRSVWPLTCLMAVAAMLANSVGIAAVYVVAAPIVAALGDRGDALIATTRVGPAVALLCAGSVLISVIAAALTVAASDSES